MTSMRKSMSMSDITALREESEHERHYSVAREVHELAGTKFANTGRACRTRPQSPTLHSKARSRPHISQKEKEDMELEEMKKHKIKAQPIPKSILVAPQSLPEVPKKPLTIIEPFKLTEIQKKCNYTSHHVPAFKARPAPKHIFEKPDIPVQMTKAIIPKFHKKCCSKEKLNDKTQHMNQKGTAQHHMPTVYRKLLKPEPFSFEQRNEELKKRKEARIRRQIEEEKMQASSFKAQPLPGAVKKRMHTNLTKGSSSSTSSENKENDVILKAEPATFLHTIDLAPSDLMTEKRAEREKYDKQITEREQEKELKEMQDRDEVELRAKSVNHPKPVPDLAVPVKPITYLTVPDIFARLDFEQSSSSSS